MDNTIQPPEGYRFLETGEKPQMGDLVYNAIGQRWALMSDDVLVIAEALGATFFIPPARLIQATDDIDGLINQLDSIARSYDNNYYGLPVYDDSYMNMMRQAVKDWLRERQ